MHSRFNGAFAGLTTFAIAAGLLAIAPVSRAQAVEYVKICPLFGAGYYYLPGRTSAITRRQATPGC